jgi:hypothetical protein
LARFTNAVIEEIKRLDAKYNTKRYYSGGTLEGIRKKSSQALDLLTKTLREALSR